MGWFLCSNLGGNFITMFFQYFTNFCFLYNGVDCRWESWKYSYSFWFWLSHAASSWSCTMQNPLIQRLCMDSLFHSWKEMGLLQLPFLFWVQWSCRKSCFPCVIFMYRNIMQFFNHLRSLCISYNHLLYPCMARVLSCSKDALFTVWSGDLLPVSLLL